MKLSAAGKSRSISYWEPLTEKNEGVFVLVRIRKSPVQGPLEESEKLGNFETDDAH